MKSDVFASAKKLVRHRYQFDMLTRSYDQDLRHI